MSARTLVATPDPDEPPPFTPYRAGTYTFTASEAGPVRVSGLGTETATATFASGVVVRLPLRPAIGGDL